MSELDAKYIALGAEGVRQLIVDLVTDLLVDCQEMSDIALIGVQKGGVPLAHEIHRQLSADSEISSKLQFGTIDISFNRDDIESRGNFEVSPSDIEFDINDKEVILVDDVLASGRTIRAAINSIMQLGRPKRIRLAVLVDRGRRQLPIEPDYVARIMSVPQSENVELVLSESHPEENSIILVPKKREGEVS